MPLLSRLLEINQLIWRLHGHLRRHWQSIIIIGKHKIQCKSLARSQLLVNPFNSSFRQTSCHLDGFYFWVCGWNHREWSFKRMLSSSILVWCCLSFCGWNPKHGPFKSLIRMKDIADVVSRDTVCYVVQGGSNFWLCGLKCVHSNEGYWVIFAAQPIVLEIKVVLTFKCVDEILEQSFWEVRYLALFIMLP